jgi:anamorsin
MSPIVLDVTSDFNPANNGPAPTSSQRTLLLAPPSLAAHEDRVSALFSAFDRTTTDLHMLDRLAAGLVTLPPATYDLVLVLTDADGSRRDEVASLLVGRDIWVRLVPAIKAGGVLRSEDGSLKSAAPEAREAVLAGLVAGAEGFTKPEYAEEEVVPLRFGSKKKAAAAPAPAPAVQSALAPTGVGFVVDFSDDLDLDAEDDDDALIDEDTLLTEEDLRRPIPQPPECQPQPGKKRRACKDCTCGLAERMFSTALLN